MLIYLWEERKDLQNTLNITFNKPKPKEKYKKYLVNSETIITANYYGSMRVDSQFQMFNSRPEKLPSRCQSTTLTLTLTLEL